MFLQVCLCVYVCVSVVPVRSGYPAIKVINIICLHLKAFEYLSPTQHSAGVLPPLGDPPGLPWQPWIPWLHLCVGEPLGVNYDSSFWLKSGYPHTPVRETPTHVSSSLCLSSSIINFFLLIPHPPIDICWFDSPNGITYIYLLLPLFVMFVH